jgi:hypothetical protein
MQSFNGKANPPPKGEGFNTPKTDDTTNTWLTPLSLIQSLGMFDLDPCCPPVMPWRTATEMHHYPDMGRGLTRPLNGRAFVNPPYGEHTFKWMRKFAEHKRGIALIFARTDTRGFHEHVFSSAKAIYFLKGRVGVERVQIVTDSMYVYDNHKRAATWRSNKWLSADGRPLENSDLWKRFLSVRLNVRIRTEIIWQKGKKSPTLKMVDRTAKAAGKAPRKYDRGYRGGKVARSKVTGGSPLLYPAKGQEAVIRIYRSGLIRKTGHKLTFDLYDETSTSFVQKCTAYAEANIAGELQRQHCYRVRFNDHPKHPLIEEILGEIEPATLELKTTDADESLTESGLP